MFAGEGVLHFVRMVFLLSRNLVPPERLTIPTSRSQLNQISTGRMGDGHPVLEEVSLSFIGWWSPF